ncbi:hypothetical protein BgiMline_015634 [Biomphalaria glabrata]
MTAIPRQSLHQGYDEATLVTFDIVVINSRRIHYENIISSRHIHYGKVINSRHIHYGKVINSRHIHYGKVINSRHIHYRKVIMRFIYSSGPLLSRLASYGQSRPFLESVINKLKLTRKHEHTHRAHSPTQLSFKYKYKEMSLLSLRRNWNTDVQINRSVYRVISCLDGWTVAE